MEGYKGLSKKECRKLSVKCIIFSILGMMILFATNYNLEEKTLSMPSTLFVGMMASAALILLIGIAGFILTSVKHKND